MTALTPDDLARIEELAEKATPGPWELSGEDVILGPQPDASGWLPGHGPRRYWIIEENTGEGGGYTIEPEDAAFIVSARTAVPTLVAGVRSLQARLAQAEATIETIGKSAQDGLADCDDDYEMSSLWVLDQCNAYRAGAPK